MDDANMSKLVEAKISGLIATVQTSLAPAAHPSESPLNLFEAEQRLTGVIRHMEEHLLAQLRGKHELVSAIEDRVLSLETHRR